MGDDTPELSGVSFDFHERSAKLGFLRTLGEGLFQKAPDAVLLALDAQEVLDFLSSAGARDVAVEEEAAHDLVPR